MCLLHVWCISEKQQQKNKKQKKNNNKKTDLSTTHQNN